MRRLSQEVFALFKRVYIDPRRNFFSECSDILVESFLGEVPSQLAQQASRGEQSKQDCIDCISVDQRVSSARSAVNSFVIYQLSNTLPPNGSGVGCGYYDECGAGDGHGIARLMNEYVFGICFNPEIHEDNVFHFLDHCLSHLSNSFFSGGDEEGLVASTTGLPGGLDPEEMGRYWHQHRELIRQRVQHVGERQVVTYNYTVSYSEYLTEVFAVLDRLADEATAVDAETDEASAHPS